MNGILSAKTESQFLNIVQDLTTANTELQDNNGGEVLHPSRAPFSTQVLTTGQTASK
jgi:hypothetical protein